MRNKYLLLGAASTLMLAACSEDINQGPENNRPVENALNLTSLSPASQAGRVSLPGQTRGIKADRLQLVAKIAPIAESQAAEHMWSATGIAINGNTAYVSWHSDHQASTPANAWGGAIDQINIAALAGEGDVITNTAISTAVKFNNVVYAGGNLYLPLTNYANGASVGRWDAGSTTMDFIAVPGSSANAIEVNGGTMTVVTGYKGGVYSLPTDFNAETEVSEVVAYDENFGGKYVVNGSILRTTAEESFLVSPDGTERSLGAPLVSEMKYAESYDGENGTWENVGNQAQYYGKHTMAVADGYIYVGGGQGDNSKNGLRVYGAAGSEPVWENGTNTTAVCVEGDYVYAATGAGLRVYKKYNGTDLELYAFEVLDYDENGNAADAENDNKPAAGTGAHSSNFVAVGGGYIFVACGQSGVYVFKLNEINMNETGFKTDTGINRTQEVKDGETVTIKVPEGPTENIPEGYEGFDKWVDEETGIEYTPGQEVPFESGVIIVLTARYKEKTTSETGFKIVNGDSFTKEIKKETTEDFEVPAAPTTAPEGQEFDYWEGSDGKQYTPGTSVPLTAGTVIYLTPIYKDKAPVYDFTVKFDLEPENTGATGDVPADIKFNGLDKKEYSLTFPAQGNITREGFDFKGWFDKRNSAQSIDDPIYEADKTYTFEIEDGETVKTFYPVWTKKVTQGGGEGGHGTDA